MLHIPIPHWQVGIWRGQRPSYEMIGWGSLTISILASSTYSAFAKNLSTALSPLTLLFVGQALVATFILLSFGFVPTCKQLCTLPKKQVLPLLFVGVTNGIMAPLLWFTGIQSTAAINAALFSKVDMVFLFVLAVMYAGEKVHRAHLFSALLIAIGIIVIVFEGFSQTGISLAMGDALILSASFVTAVGSFMFRQFLHGVPPQIVLLTRNMMGMGFFFVLSPFVPTTLYAEISVFPFALIGTLLGFCFIAQFLNIFSFYQAIDRLPISHVSLCVSLEIIGSAAFAHWYLKEAFYGYHFVGGALIFSGIIVLEVMSSRWSLRHKESQLVQERVNIA